MQYGLGIDLGTTQTAAAVRVDGRIDVVRLGGRRAEIPSLVFVKPDGGLLIGEAAERRGQTEPARLAREFKRRIGDPVPILVGGTPFSAHALTAKLLRHVLDTVTQMQGAPPAAVIVTHPANWGPYKREQLDQAIRQADAEHVQVRSEPEAAALQHATARRIAPGETVAVYDLGGGTFDVAVLRREGDGFVLLGEPEGIEQLGGIDFDEAVFGHVVGVLGSKTDGLDPDDPEVVAALARLRRDCVEAKESLSFDTETMIPVALPGLHTRVRLNRSELESMIAPSLADTVAATARALRAAGVAPEQLSAILLAGGSSRIPLVAQLLSTEFQRPVVADPHPEHSIAMGAAVATAGASGSTPPFAAAPRGNGNAAPPVDATLVDFPGAASPVASPRRKGEAAAAAAGPITSVPVAPARGVPVAPGRGSATPSRGDAAGAPVAYSPGAASVPGTASAPGIAPSSGAGAGGYGAAGGAGAAGYGPGGGAGAGGFGAAGAAGGTVTPGQRAGSTGSAAAATSPPAGTTPPTSGTPGFATTPGFPGTSGTPDAGRVWPPPAPPAPPRRNTRLLVIIGALSVALLAGGTTVVLALTRDNDKAADPDAAATTPAAPPSAAATDTPVELPTARILVRVDTGGESPPARKSKIYFITPGRDDRVELPGSETGDVLPKWSNDRKQIALTHVNDDGKTTDIYLMNADGSNRRKVLDDAGGEVSWSADDQKIAFMRKNQVWTLNLDGSGDTTQLTRSSVKKDDAVWSPAGSTIIYWRDDGGVKQLYELDVAAPKEPGRRITGPEVGPANDPAFSPDGSQILYTRELAGGTTSDIWMVDTTGENAHKVTSNPDREMDATWSPDGTWFAFVRGAYTKPTIVVARPDGSDEQLLTRKGVREGHPCWF
ncbi:MAG: Hsp70 family protein [Actinoplanes sp.]